MITRLITRVFDIASQDTDAIDEWFEEMYQEFSNIEIVGYTGTMTGLAITVEVEYKDELEETSGGMPH